MKKIITLLIIVGCLISLVWAVTESITNFEGKADPHNITFQGNENQTEYMKIPIYSHVNNITIKIKGYQTS